MVCKEILQLARQSSTMIATAESCTGGMIAVALTDIAGSSDAFDRGFVTYSNAAKSSALGIPPDLIREHGAVSEPVACAMAEGALTATGASHALATTGVAGPGGGTEAKPVGTVHIALASQGLPTLHRRFLLSADRETFKFMATQSALDLLRERLLG